MAEIVGTEDVEKAIMAKLEVAGRPTAVRSDGFEVAGFPPQTIDAVLD
eukprot:SAG11_NODE_21390_length_426_cov_0.782875_1_plen_47_part_10